jgi:hypothetical protein
MLTDPNISEDEYNQFMVNYQDKLFDKGSTITTKFTNIN